MVTVCKRIVPQDQSATASSATNRNNISGHFQVTAAVAGDTLAKTT